MKSRSQTKDHDHWSGRLVHRRNGQRAVRMTSTDPVALGKAYEHHVGKALPTCSYTKNSLLTALVKLGWSVISMIVFCAAAGQSS